MRIYLRSIQIEFGDSAEVNANAQQLKYAKYQRNGYCVTAYHTAIGSLGKSFRLSL